jgi:LPXTG-motif cell wall-anchored protein
VDSGPITVVDLIPAGLSFVSATNDPLVAGQAVSWDLPSLAPEGVLSITIIVKITDITQPTYVNRAEIVEDGADAYDTPGKDIEDEDSTPDSNVFNDPLIDTDDVNIDVIPGDEDDHDRALLDTTKVASDNPAVTGPLPSTGSDLQPLLFTAAGLLAAGVLGVLAARRRRRPIPN